MKDILLDSMNDLAVKDGDFDIQYSDIQNVTLLMISEKGDFKESPAIGIGLVKYLDSPSSSKQRLRFIREVTLQIEADGGSNPEIQIEPSGNITVRTTYK
ncbi:MAG: hypothetical protein HPY80_00215 [Bacteroidales bacterium]|nr:hypothetical protein [Bacteroidales bacterium]